MYILCLQIVIASIMASYNKEDWTELAIASEVKLFKTSCSIICIYTTDRNDTLIAKLKMIVYFQREV